MKLINFEFFEAFNKLRERMGAALVDSHDGEIDWDKLDIKLQTVGLDVPVEDIDIDEIDGTFSYKGRKVIIHIRDVNHNNRYDEPQLPKYHVANCRTIDLMKKKERFEARYVVSTREDGFYLINLIDLYTGEMLEKMVEKQLDVCKNCLTHIDYDGYKQDRFRRKVIFSEFDIHDYFEIYGASTVTKPKHTDKTAPLNCYTDTWDKVSNDYRESCHWQCELCGLDLAKKKNFLHVHHKDGVKGNNKTSNLEALCFACHAEQPGKGHESLRKNKNYSICLQLRAEYLVFSE